MDLNKVMLIGNLTRDPEIRTLPSGDGVANFGLATNRVWTDANKQRQQMVEYHNIVAWRRLAEICGQYLKKGNKVYIEGRMQTREWQGQDGIKRYRTEVIARDMIMLTPLAGPRAGAARPTSFAPPVQGVSPEETPATVPTIELEEKEQTTGEPSETPTEEKKEAKEEEEGISVEDIPF